MRFNSVQQAAIFHTPQRSLKVTKEFQPKFASTDGIDNFFATFALYHCLPIEAEGRGGLHGHGHGHGCGLKLPISASEFVQGT